MLIDFLLHNCKKHCFLIINAVLPYLVAYILNRLKPIPVITTVWALFEHKMNSIELNMEMIKPLSRFLIFVVISSFLIKILSDKRVYITLLIKRFVIEVMKG